MHDQSWLNHSKEGQYGRALTRRPSCGCHVCSRTTPQLKSADLRRDSTFIPVVFKLSTQSFFLTRKPIKSRLDKRKEKKKEHKSHLHRDDYQEAGKRRRIALTTTTTTTTTKNSRTKNQKKKSKKNTSILVPVYMHQMLQVGAYPCALDVPPYVRPELHLINRDSLPTSLLQSTALDRVAT